MVGQELEGVNYHSVSGLGAPDDAKDDLGQLLRGFQEEATLDGEVSDLDQALLTWHETKSSCHIA